MIIVMFACSQKAYLLMQELKQGWMAAHPFDTVACCVKTSSLPEESSENSISKLTGEWFSKADALIYFGAAGIAVRCIAPYLTHKAKDPAVLVLDEAGCFCISLLSGHAGGANELAEEITELLREKGTIPVITTATDREGKFAVDDFARKNHLLLGDWRLAKKISAGILRGEKIGFASEIEVCGKLPEELQDLSEENLSEEKQNPAAEMVRLQRKERPGMGIWISYRSSKGPYKETLQLIPQSLVLGIGCRKGTPEEKIGQAVCQCFQEEGLLPDAVAAAASIDLKNQEQGILAYCERNNLPFLFFSKEELMQVEGTFTSSAFVEEITGVDNVCERSALLGAKKISREKVRLLVRKKCCEGVTVAVADFSSPLRDKTFRNEG